MNFRTLCLLMTCVVSVALATVDTVSAQCSTCPAPTIAYQPVAYPPVAYQPTVAVQPRTGWYPGKLLDRLRMRRWGFGATTVAPTYTAAYAPAAYPAAYTASYRPYLSSYAPLASPACNTCTQTALYPAVQTVARPVMLSPSDHCGCSACNYQPSSCSACSSCSSCATQAVYSEPACSSCAVSTPSFPSGSTTVLPPTPRPALPAQPAPSSSTYDANRPVSDNNGNVVPVPGDDSSTFRAPPLLLNPSDRSARREMSRGPTVDVINTVYRQPVTTDAVGHRPAKTQAQIDAEGWSAVPRR